MLTVRLTQEKSFLKCCRVLYELGLIHVVKRGSFFFHSPPSQMGALLVDDSSVAPHPRHKLVEYIHIAVDVWSLLRRRHVPLRWHGESGASM